MSQDFRLALTNFLNKRQPSVNVAELPNGFFRARLCLRENTISGFGETPEEAIARAQRLYGGAGVFLR
jgi:hypothetical protein